MKKKSDLKRWEHIALGKGLSKQRNLKYESELKLLQECQASQLSFTHLHTFNTADHTKYLMCIINIHPSLYPQEHITKVKDLQKWLNDPEKVPAKAEEMLEVLDSYLQKVRNSCTCWRDQDDVQAKYIIQVLKTVQGEEITCNHQTFTRE